MPIFNIRVVAERHVLVEGKDYIDVLDKTISLFDHKWVVTGQVVLGEITAKEEKELLKHGAVALEDW